MADEILPPKKTPPLESQSIGNIGSLLSAVGVFLLSASFLGTFGFASVWAFGHLLGLPQWATYPFYAIVAAGVLWGVLWATGRAWHIEKKLESGQDIDQPVFEALHYFRTSPKTSKTTE